MSTRTCRFCAEEIQAAAILCKHCGKAVANSEIQEVARGWGALSDEGRKTQWERLSAEDKEQLRAAIEYFASQPRVVPSQVAAKKRTHPATWGCLVLIILVAIGAMMPGTRSSDSSQSPEIRSKVTNCSEEYGFTKTEGYVENAGKVTVNYVKLTTRWKDSSGQVVDTNFTYAVGPQYLRPGERSLFESSTKHPQAYTCVAELSDFKIVR